MADVGLVLVDTSVWVRFLRVAHSLEAQVLDTLLVAGPVATCPPIRAEVISSASTKRECDRLLGVFDALVMLEPPPRVWELIAEYRFALARRGIHASLVDLFIAVTAHTHRVALWTLDDDFTHIVEVLPFNRFHPRSTVK